MVERDSLWSKWDVGLSVTSKAFLKAISCLALAAGMFCLGAVYNRFPVLYPDSVSHLYSAKFFTFQGDRPVTYSLWLAAGYAIFPSYWFGVVAQSLIAALLIRWVMLAHGILRLNLFHCLVCAVLALVTGICWQTGRLIPDVFTALMVLSFYLLVFCPHKIGRVREATVTAILVFSLLVHYSHWVILVVALAFLWAGYRALGKRLFKGSPLLLVNSVLLVFPLTIALNQSLGLNFIYSKNQYAFLLSRLVEDGSVAKFLEKNCEGNKFIFCDDRAYVTGQSVAGFLWGKGGPFWPAEGQAREYRELILGIFQSDPWGQLGAGLKEFGLQLVRFGSGDSLGGFPEGGWESANLRRASLREFGRFERSRQQEGSLSWLVFRLNKIYYFFFWLSALFLVGFALKQGSSRGREKALAITIGLFLVSNAFVCGVFSGVNDRYQSRVAWLPVFAALVILVRLWEASLSSSSRSARSA